MNVTPKLTASLAGAALLSMTMGHTAEAATIRFQFTNTPTGIQPSILFSESGLNLTVQALTRGGSALNVTHSSNGLGADGVGSNPANPFSPLEGRPGVANDELLTFSFTNAVSGQSQRVRLRRIIFDGVDDTDNFALIKSEDAVIFGNRDIPEAPTANNADQGRFTFGQNASHISNLFQIQARQNDDDFYVRAIDVETVPEPSFLLGLLASAGVAYGIKRRHQADAETTEG